MMNLKTNSYKQAICKTKSHPFKSDSLNFILFTFKRKQYFLSSIPFDFILYYWTSGYTFVFVLFNIRTLSSSDAIFPWLLPSVPFSLYIWIVNSSYMEMHFFFLCRQLQSTDDIECGRGWQQKCDNYSLDLNTSQKTWAYNTFSSIMFFVLWVVIPGTNARRVNFPLNSFLSSSLALTILIHFFPVCSFFISQAICLWCIWCWTLW